MSGPTPAVALGIAWSQLTFKAPPVNADFSGQTVIVTGGNNGLGKETIRQLLQLKVGKIIMAVRSLDKGHAAKQELESSSDIIDVWQLDQANYASVKAFAERVKTLDRVDAALLNAGSWPTGHSTAEGHELTITVNVISTMLLATLLLPKLRENTDSPRLILVGSNLHKFASLKARHQEGGIFAAIDKQQLKTSDEFDVRYQDSKMLLQICTNAVAAEQKAQHGDAVCIAIMNPGYCQSDLNPPKNMQYRIRQKLLQRTTEEGGRIMVDSLALEKVKGRNGAYLDDCRISNESPWLSTEDGKKTSARVWQEMQEMLAAIEKAG